MFNRYDLKRLNFISFCCVAFVIAVIFLHSIERRELHLAGTWSINTFDLCPTCVARHQWHAATTMIYMQNWLNEGAAHLKFLLVSNPKSIEMQTLDERIVYPSFPVGAYVLTYLYLMGMSALSPDIITNPTLQLLSLTALSYAAHAMFVCLLCLLIFKVVRRLRFNHLNASIIATIPALASFHSAFPLYYFHTIWDHSIAVIPLYVLFVYFETLRYLGVKLTRFQNFVQLATMFGGAFCDWLFVPVLIVAFIMRIHQGWIVIADKRMFIWQSMKFFALPALAIAIWLAQYLLYSYQPGLVFSEEGRQPIIEAMQANDYRLGDVLLHRIGADNVRDFITQIYTPLLTQVKHGYGSVGLIFLLLALYLACRCRDLRQGKVLCKLYFLLTLPVILHTLMLSNHAYEHLFSSLRFAPAISVAILMCALLIGLSKGGLRLPLIKVRGVPIYRSTAVCLLLTLIYVSFHYLQMPLKKYFSTPDYTFTVMGQFIRDNSSYSDVLFSKQTYIPALPPQRLAFTGKRVYYADNLDHVFGQTQQLRAEDFMIKIIYLIPDNEKNLHIKEDQEYKDIKTLDIFLNNQGIITKHTTKKTSWHDGVFRSGIFALLL